MVLRTQKIALRTASAVAIIGGLLCMSDMGLARPFVGAAAQNPAHLAAPVKVSMLDYASLKTMALARSDSPDWERIATVSDEAADYWTEVSPQIKQKALRSLVDRIMSGIKNAKARQSIYELQFAVGLELDAVDLLENYFAKK